MVVGLAMFGKFSVASSFAVLYVYASELMPTIVRAEAMGIASFVAGFGLLIFPYILQMVIDSIMCNLSYRHGGGTKMFGTPKNCQNRADTQIHWGAPGSSGNL